MEDKYLYKQSRDKRNRCQNSSSPKSPFAYIDMVEYKVREVKHIFEPAADLRASLGQSIASRTS